MAHHEPARTKHVGGTVSKAIGLHYTCYIDNLISSGRYLTVAEVLREAMRLHEKMNTPVIIQEKEE